MGSDGNVERLHGDKSKIIDGRVTREEMGRCHRRILSDRVTRQEGWAEAALWVLF